MIDVVYILGKGSKWSNNELRYSLRSLEKYGLGVGQVHVIGENPGFLSKEVHYEFCADPSNRCFNHAHKVRFAFEETKIDRLLLMYDDLYFLKPTSLTDYPNYTRGDLPVKRLLQRGYRRSLANTRLFLVKNKKSFRSYTIHCPFIYEARKFLSLNPIWDSLRNGRPKSVRSIYGNWFDLPATPLLDCKIRLTKTKEAMWEVVKDRHLFSIQDQCIENGMSDLLLELFPDRSRYEAS